MTNATSTVLILAIPLGLVTILPFGWLRSRLVFLALGVPLFVIAAVLIFAGLFASGMSAGHGSGESGGWYEFGPLLLWISIGGALLIGGIIVRPKAKQPKRTELKESKFPTLREDKAAKQDHIQDVDLSS